MAQAVGSLFIDLAMNTAAFASDLGKTTASLASWSTTQNTVLAGVVNSWRGVQKEIAKTTEEVFSLKSGMLALIGGGIIGEVIKGNLEAAKAMTLHAEAIGITTDTLQEYQYVAKLSGVSTETMTGAFEKFGKNLGELQAGTGSLYNHLKITNTGLLEQLKHVTSVDQGLRLLFDTMGRLDTQQARLSLSGAAFSRGGLEMTNMVRHGTAAMDGQIAKAHELGLIIDHDLLENAEGATVKIDTLAAVLKAKLMVAIISNAQQIGEFADKMTDLIPKVVSFGVEAANAANYLYSLGGASTDLAIRMEEAAAWAAKASLFITSNFTDGDSKGLKEMDAAIDAEVKERIDKLRAHVAEVKQLAEEASSWGNNNSRNSASIGSTIHESNLVDQIDQQKEAAKAAEGIYKKLESAATSTYNATRTEAEKYAITVAELDKELHTINKTTGETMISQDTYNRALERATENYKHLGSEAKKTFESTRTPAEKYAETVAKLNEELNTTNTLTGKAFIDQTTYNRAIEKADEDLHKATITGSLYADIMDKAISGNIKSWRDLGQAVLAYAQTVLKAMATGNGQTNIFGGLGSLLGMFGGSGGGAAADIASDPAYIATVMHSGGYAGSGGMTRQVDSSIFAGARRMHSGGLAGDEVPAILQRGERVLTAKQQADQGGGNTYNIDARGADSGVEQRLRFMIENLSSSIESRAVMATQNARFRNPALFGG